MGETVSEIPRWQRVMRRIYDGYLVFRYRDPVQREAQTHLHDDLTFVDKRIADFIAAPGPVQRQVVRELNQKIEFRKPGNSSPAMSGLVAIAGTTVTLIGAIYLAVYNGWFSMLAAVTDPKTGQIHGVTPAQSSSVMGGISAGIVWWGIGFVVFGLLIFWAARSRDKERATSRVWLKAYEDALTER